MSTIWVEWVEVSSLLAIEVLKITPGPVRKLEVEGHRVCDFCSGPFPDEGVVPQLQGLRAVATTPTGCTIMEPPWSLCDNCRLALGLRLGDEVVDLAEVRRLYREKTEEYIEHFPTMRGLLQMEVYGTG